MAFVRKTVLIINDVTRDLTPPLGADPRNVHAVLDGLGYNVEFGSLAHVPSDAKLNTYEFIVSPFNQANGIRVILDNAGVTVPIFLLFTSDDVDVFSATAADRPASSRVGDVAQFFDSPYSSSEWNCVYGTWYVYKTDAKYDVLPLITASATEPTDSGSTNFSGAAQAQAGSVNSFSYIRQSSSTRCYVAGSTAADFMDLPFLIQAAINDGSLSSVPLRVPMCMEIDHINSTRFHDDSVFRDYLTESIKGVMWCGVDTNDDPTQTTGLPQLMIDWINANQANGKFKLSYHEHRAAAIIATGTFPNVTGETKANQETNYASAKAIWDANGISMDFPAHNNPGGNAWDNSTMELYSPDESIASDGAETVSQAGYGYRTTRDFSGSEQSFGDLTNVHWHMTKQRYVINGITMIRSQDMDISGGATLIADWYNNWRYLQNAPGIGLALYLHPEDLELSTQDPGIASDEGPRTTGSYGRVVITQFNDIGAYLKDVVVHWADITKFVPAR